jgi:hypothetical protein
MQRSISAFKPSFTLFVADNQPLLVMGEAWNISSHSESPLSTPTAKAAKTRASLRPPIFNPYDRFTQPEFDAWIGDITSALKRALDHETEPAVDSPSRHSGGWNTIPARVGGNLGAEGRVQSPVPSEDHGEESAFEDSFAQIASRRAKGKARDPREGPGLGRKGQPIELLSDSEEEEEVVDSLEADAVNSEDLDDITSEDETDDVESDVDEGGEVCVGQPGTSAQHIVTCLPSDGSFHDQDVVGRSEAKSRHIRDEGLQFPRNSAIFLEDGGDKKQGPAVPEIIGGMDGGAWHRFIASHRLQPTLSQRYRISHSEPRCNSLRRGASRSVGWASYFC